MTRHILYLTNTRMVSLTARSGRLVARREFAVSGAGMEDFERHLASLADVPTNLIIDLSEEDFRLDTIPHVGNRDRAVLLNRKLNQIFRGSPYRFAIAQGREPEGRRDDRVVYTAVTNPELLQPWVDALERVKAPLSGIHSSAVISGSLLEVLDLVFPHALLVSFTPGGAVRQTYFRSKELRFSRLTPIDLEPGQTLGSLLAEETTRTWQYLESIRNFAPDDRLEVCVLAHPKDRPAIEPALRDFAQIQYRMIDIEQVAAKLGLKPPPVGSSAEEILVHHFLRKPVENHFASPEQLRHAALRTARRTITQASLVVLAAGIVWGGVTLAKVLDGDKADQRLTQQLMAINREYDDIMRTQPAGDVGGNAMRDAVAFYNGSLKGFPTLVEFAAPLSNALRVHPRVRLLQFSWLASAEGREPTLTASSLRDAPAVRALAPTGQGVPTPSQAPGPAGSADPFNYGKQQVALLEATVRVNGDDYRDAIAEVERLVADVERLPGFSATIVESPLDTRPGRAIQGRLGERPAGPTEARFVLRIARERANT